MKYNLLGETGVLVSELCFGAMTFGGTGIWGAIGQQQQDEVNTLMKMAVDGGINFFDTANVYSTGLSEQLLGASLNQVGLNRHDLFIATKVRGRMGEGVNQLGLSRYHIMQSVEASLQRLQLSHVDLLYVHGVDLATSVEQVVHTLHDVVVSGKVRYIGVCNWPAWMVMKALSIARARGWHEFVAMQYFYSLANRDAEHDLLPLALDQSQGFMPWSPLAGGFLSGKFTRHQTNTGGQSRRDTFDFPVINKDRAYDIVDVLLKIGARQQVSAAEVALAWVRQQRGVTSTIIGAKTPEQLQSNIRSATLELTSAELEELSAVSQAEPVYPNWMVDRQMGDRMPANK
jgi:aryl-alcohol dehydrogenase-like predicted oxidoreductase